MLLIDNFCCISGQRRRAFCASMRDIYCFRVNSVEHWVNFTQAGTH